MKTVLMVSFGLLSFASHARSDCISIYSDTNVYSCHLYTLVEPPSINTVYIIHSLNTGSTASQFKVIDNSGLFPASQQTRYLALGTWNTDLSLAYGSCIVGDHVLMTLNFFWFGVPLTDCDHTLRVAPAPTSPIPGSIAVADCAAPRHNIEEGSEGWGLYVRSDSHTCLVGCGCEDFHVAVDAATWGAVKALYR